MFNLDQAQIFNGSPSPVQGIMKRSASGKQRNQYGLAAISRGIISNYNPLEPELLNPSEANKNQLTAKLTLNRDGSTENSPKKRRRQKAFTQLAPLAQTVSTLVYTHMDMPATNDSIFEQPSWIKSTKQDCSIRQKQIKRNRQQKIDSSSKILFYEDNDSAEEQPKSTNSQQVIEIKKIFEERSKQNVLFEISSEEPEKSYPTEQFVIISASRLDKAAFYSHSSSDQEDETSGKQINNKESSREPKLIYRRDQMNNMDAKAQVLQVMQPKHTWQMVLNRNKDGFNSFWPEFYLQFETDSSPLIASKRVSSKPASTFVISTNANNFTENSKFYLGKLKANIFGSIINLFGVGLNPSQAKDQNRIPRQLLATIVFTKTSYNKPRQFEVFVKKPQYRYYLNFHQVTMYGDELPLHQLYNFPENRSKIDKFCNRKPIYNKTEETYTLNFRGKAECKSIKNFILERSTGGEDVMMFGKVNDSKFNIEISHPLSVLVGFAVALVNFDNRLLFNE